jgi:Zn-dependent protease with chaperone function
MVGFYLLALAVIGVLLWLPYAEWTYGGRIHFQLLICAPLAAIAIFVAVVPRRDKFEPPGPHLASKDHPELFALIDDVARDTGQPPPKDVYLVPDANAFVTQRGGWMGFGGRRVMGLGLPLLQTLSVTEMRAVLAHEFGHFHHGDTALGPWIHATRAAIARTLSSLRQSTVRFAFVWYWKAFLRATHAISRAQEFAADALAARTVGADALTSGLRKVAGVAAAQSAYLQQEVAPVLRAGRRPPLAAGFEQFLCVPRIQASVQALVEAEMREARDDPYDTHPPLSRRIEALSKAESARPVVDDRPAIALLNDPASLEAPLIETITGWRVAATRPPIAWSEVGRDVYLPAWRKSGGEVALNLAGMTPSTLPTDAASLAAVGRRFVSAPGDLAAETDFGANAIGIALAVLLARVGWTPRCELGEPVAFERGGDRIEPFDAPRRLAAGELTEDEWRALCRRAGIADVDLGTAGRA